MTPELKAQVGQDTQPEQHHPQVLAYMGDAVYEVCVRSLIISYYGQSKTHQLHSLTVKLVSAPMQANVLNRIAPYLTQKEKNMVRRGRNVKTSQVPKGATPQEYCLATGLEALIGYLYLSGEDERIKTLLKNASLLEALQEK